MIFLVTQMLLCLLIAFLLGLLLGWWLGRRKLEELEASFRQDLERCHEERDGSRAEIADCRDRLEQCLAREAAVESGSSTLAPIAAQDAGFGERLKGGREVATGESEDAAPDDLKIVEGIGPKIEGLLNAEGIRTWARLAGTEVGVLQAILDKAGPRYRIHDPGTWPRQAALAAAGSWDELEELQDRLKGGRET